MGLKQGACVLAGPENAGGLPERQELDSAVRRAHVQRVLADVRVHIDARGGNRDCLRVPPAAASDYELPLHLRCACWLRIVTYCCMSA